jgi:hypothetical protein
LKQICGCPERGAFPFFESHQHFKAIAVVQRKYFYSTSTTAFCFCCAIARCGGLVLLQSVHEPLFVSFVFLFSLLVSRSHGQIELIFCPDKLANSSSNFLNRRTTICGCIRAERDESIGYSTWRIKYQRHPQQHKPYLLHSSAVPGNSVPAFDGLLSACQAPLPRHRKPLMSTSAPFMDQGSRNVQRGRPPHLSRMSKQFPTAWFCPGKTRSCACSEPGAHGEVPAICGGLPSYQPSK